MWHLRGPRFVELLLQQPVDGTIQRE
jgi:hypothetical protein